MRSEAGGMPGQRSTAALPTDPDVRSAVLPDVPEEHRRTLLHQGCIVRDIQPVYLPESQTQFAMAYYVVNYSKLRIWEFVEYERMVCENVDHLDAGSFYAVKDCFKMLVKKWWDIYNDETLDYKQQPAGDEDPLQTALAERGAATYFPA